MNGSNGGDVVIEFKGKVDEHELMKWAKAQRRNRDGSAALKGLNSGPPNTVEFHVWATKIWGRDQTIFESVLRMPGYGSCRLATKRLA